MSDTSARLALPLLQAAQAQKHVTHNEALARLDLLVQLALEAFDADTPPALPDNGQIWATGGNPTGVWAGQPDMLAAWSNGAWVFIAPQNGWIATQTGNGALRVRTAAGWTAIGLAQFDNLDGLGIATTHDATNRLAVAADASLLTHAGAGHRLKLNKADPTDTASLLFQTGFGGRAEMGTAGSDDFSIKVSADGSAWATAIGVNASSGQVAIDQGLTLSGALDGTAVQQGATDTTPGRLARADYAYGPGNVLGDVAQAGGLPTGAVLERGSNANGHYLRLADGTQICWKTTVSGPVTQFGTGTFANPYSSVGAVWTFPAAFSTPPVVNAQVETGTIAGAARRMVAIIGTISATAVNDITISRFSSDPTPSTPNVHKIATGRWF